MNTICPTLPKTEEAAYSTTPSQDHGHWQARLDLGFRSMDRGCRLYRQSHQGPLYVQKPFYPEGKDLAHIYLLHPPGGLVSGDELRITLDLEQDTKVLITTPGAGRVYRAREDKRLQKQINTLNVDEGATLEWFPQETILYDGAHARLETHIHLKDDAMFCGWEISSLGLPAGKLPFETGSFSQQLRIFKDGLPCFVENFVIDEKATQALNCGMRGQPINGLMVMGSCTGENKISDDLLEQARDLCASFEDNLLAVTRIRDFLVARYLGDCSEQARNRFIALWELLRPTLMNRPACKPRIWAT